MDVHDDDGLQMYATYTVRAVYTSTHALMHCACDIAGEQLRPVQTAFGSGLQSKRF